MSTLGTILLSQCPLHIAQHKRENADLAASSAPLPKELADGLMTPPSPASSNKLHTFPTLFGSSEIFLLRIPLFVWGVGDREFLCCSIFHLCPRLHSNVVTVAPWSNADVAMFDKRFEFLAFTQSHPCISSAEKLELGATLFNVVPKSFSSLPTSVLSLNSKVTKYQHTLCFIKIKIKMYLKLMIIT